MEQSKPGRDISVLDGIALVMGSAIASTHALRIIRSGLTPAGWALVWLTLGGVAITASGPFLFLARRYSRRLPGYPGVGDFLWALLGSPWVLTAILETIVPGDDPRENPVFALTLVCTLAVACLIALIVVWSRWVMVPPEQAARLESGPWTDRLGLILSIAWPIQCGLAMVVLG